MEVKNERNIETRIALKKFHKRLKRKDKVYDYNDAKYNHQIRLEANDLKKIRKEIGGPITYGSILKTYLPKNTLYLLTCKNCDFSLSELRQIKPWDSDVFNIPKEFSLIENATESFHFLQQVLYALFFGKQEYLKFNYEFCEKLDVSAQVFLDIILRDVLKLYKICDRNSELKRKLGVVKQVGSINRLKTLKNNENIIKILYSVGSMALLAKKKIPFADIESYELVDYDRDFDNNTELTKQRDAVDTTALVNYVRRSLKRVGKDLSELDKANLTNIITETLINAEEHSTVGTRFSIGYYQADVKNDQHCGMFRLVIMNFGKTIYEKFADPNCPNPKIVAKMRDLSSKYTQRSLFHKKEFEEETLWTLYALQEGVTSIAPAEYETRGNGSIQFIKSFFNLKGDDESNEFKSRLSILSGNTSIIFDGTYEIVDKYNEAGEKFSYMTFNESGEIEDKPDKIFVKFVDNYFPGTVISARIWLDEGIINRDEK